MQIRLTEKNVELLNRLRKCQKKVLPDIEMSVNKQANVLLQHRLEKLLKDYEK